MGLLPSGRRLFVHLPRELPLQVIAHHHLLQLHDVRVLELQQQGDFSQAADGDSCGGEDPAKGGAAAATPPAGPARSPLCSPSFSLSIRTFFRATISPVCVSRARSETAEQPKFPGSHHPLSPPGPTKHISQREDWDSQPPPLLLQKLPISWLCQPHPSVGFPLGAALLRRDLGTSQGRSKPGRALALKKRAAQGSF